MSRTVKHAIFWIVIYVAWTYMKSGGGQSPWFQKYLMINIVNIVIYMSAFYLLKHVQIPTFYNSKRIIAFGLSLLLSSAVMYIIWRSMGLWWIDELRGINKSHQFGNMVDYFTQTVQFYSPALLLLVWESQEERKKESNRIQQLEKEKLETELKYLKAQLNPHFLFNTLNNIYSYVVTNSPKAPDMILKLSAMLDYILYKSQKDKVSLGEEVQAIENFVGLEKNRYGDRLSLDTDYQGDMSTLVSPLILLSTVENAFKHGASGDIDQPQIKVSILEKDGTIHCQVWNTKSRYDGEKNDAYKKGIGLSNIQRQLALVYPDTHDITIDDGDDSYSVRIKIKPTK